MTLHQLDNRIHLAPATAPGVSCWLAGSRRSAKTVEKPLSRGDFGADPEAGT